MKEYPSRCGMRLFRVEESQLFTCSRCTQAKKSRLYAAPDIAPDKRICNGCYGHLLSVYDIKRSGQSDEEKADQLGAALMQNFSRAQRQEAERLFRISERRSQHLDPKSIIFLSTATLVESALSEQHSLDWSPAVIGFCKAVENELVLRLVLPMADLLHDQVPRSDLEDRDFGRLAKFCNSGDGRPPELGTMSHFLRVAGSSVNRRATSSILQTFSKLIQDLPGGRWLIDPAGLSASLTQLCMDYRNRAAHLDTLVESDYLRCRELVCGTDGLIWRMVRATMTQKQYNRV